MQIIGSVPGFELPIVDLTALDETAGESETQRVIREEAQRPFDLTSGPLLRATLLRLRPDEHVLLLLIHHIVTDGWSMSVLFKEISQLYEAAIAGRPSPLPALTMQYAGFVRWQRAALTPDRLASQLAYWRAKLAGADPVLELPTDRARPPVRTARGAVQRQVFPRALVDRLKAVGRATNTTLFMGLLAGFQALLGRYSGAEDIVVGCPTAGRSDVAVESLIGFFVNTLAFRTDLTGDPTFRELLARVFKVALEAYSHQDVPFEKLVGELNIPRSLSHTPIFQTMFILQNAPRQSFELPGLTMTPWSTTTRVARRCRAVVGPGSGDGPLSVRGCSSTVKDASRFLRKWPPATLERRSLCTPSGQKPRARREPARTGRRPSPASCGADCY